MRKTGSAVFVDRKIFTLVIFVFILNTLFLATGFYLLNSRLPNEAEEFLIKQKMAKELVDYNRKLAKSLGVDTRPQVRNALSQFNYEIELAANAEDLTKAILANGQRTQERILQETEAKHRETVLAIINQDALIKSLPGKQRVTVKLTRDQGLQVEPANILDHKTLTKISETVALGEWANELSVEVEVDEGRALLLMPYNPLDHIRTLSREIDSLRVTLHEMRSRAGFVEMMGAGIIVRIYDAEDGYTSESIIHETDVRDTVNELFAAGAKGITVGNQRLIATSAIRCVGPSILVNDERIAVNPVVIRAVGDPDVLASGLDIIRISLEISRNLSFEIERVDNLALPAYSR
ncbi:MAG: DUF881 domain-containing protein [Dethiobacter sp.]|jgi:hypothetical protein|nr:DUF881 domain-containing protein [Dethiobacter sp.]